MAGAAWLATRSSRCCSLARGNRKVRFGPPRSKSTWSEEAATSARVASSFAGGTRRGGRRAAVKLPAPCLQSRVGVSEAPQLRDDLLDEDLGAGWVGVVQEAHLEVLDSEGDVPGQFFGDLLGGAADSVHPLAPQNLR